MLCGVDLLEVDLLTGKAALYKGGAAPSYLRRGDKIYSLSSKSVPLGIIGELDAGKTEFAVEPGDMILMISDGVLPGPTATRTAVMCGCSTFFHPATQGTLTKRRGAHCVWHARGAAATTPRQPLSQ